MSDRTSGRRMSRQEAETIIVELYGFPGNSHDTRDGRDLLESLFEEMGIKALTNDAVISLAEKHQAMDNRRCRP